MKKYTEKDLLLKCAQMWFKISELLRKDSLMHTLLLKHMSLKLVVEGDVDLQKEISRHNHCFCCFIVNDQCTKCPMLNLWLKGHEFNNEEVYQCANIHSPYYIVANIENGPKRYAASLEIAEEAQRLYEKA